LGQHDLGTTGGQQQKGRSKRAMAAADESVWLLVAGCDGINAWWSLSNAVSSGGVGLVGLLQFRTKCSKPKVGSFFFTRTNPQLRPRNTHEDPSKREKER